MPILSRIGGVGEMEAPVIGRSGDVSVRNSWWIWFRSLSISGLRLVDLADWFRRCESTGTESRRIFQRELFSELESVTCSQVPGNDLEW